MDRNAEYNSLMEELGARDARAADCVERARARLRRRRALTRPLYSLALVFACFVALVNFCAPVAEACAGIPGLRELAEAVTFSRSLGDAVENEYVQPIELTQTDGDVTATVEYLIVDQKQVTVFFRLESEVFEHMAVDPEFRDPEGEHLASCAYYLNDWDVPNGQLQSATLDFVGGDVPDKLRMYLKIRDLGDWQATAPADKVSDRWDFDGEHAEPEYDARFDFLLEFDPWFTQQGRHVGINRTVELDGQEIILRDMEVYPSHLRLNVEEAGGNTAWLKSLEFRIEADGEVFYTVKNGITATGMEDSPMMTSYRADSTFFYEAKELTVVITGATWLDKDMEKIRVDLKNCEAEAMPEDAELVGARHDGKRWVVTVRAKCRSENNYSFHQVFMGSCYDAGGKKYEINSWSSGTCTVEFEETPGYFYEEFPLSGYPYDEVWLTPAYSHRWAAEQPVSVTVRIN